MIRSFKFSGLILLFGVLISCAKVLQPDAEKYPRIKDDELQAALDSLSAIKFDHFYAKIAANYKDSSQNFSFKSSLRIRRDSIVNAVITFVTIPMFNAQLTMDSIKFTDKREKCYMAKDLSFFKEKFSVDFSYRNVEELFVGMPVGYNREEKYFLVNDPFSYTMCSHRKREIKKIDRKDMKELITYYSLTPDLKNLQSMQIESLDDSTTVFINYKVLEAVDGYMVPQLIEISIQTPKQEIKVELDYKKTRVNEREDIYFVIPEGYEICK